MDSSHKTLLTMLEHGVIPKLPPNEACYQLVMLAYDYLAYDLQQSRKLLLKINEIDPDYLHTGIQPRLEAKPFSRMVADLVVWFGPLESLVLPLQD